VLPLACSLKFSSYSLYAILQGHQLKTSLDHNMDASMVFAKFLVIGCSFELYFIILQFGSSMSQRECWCPTLIWVAEPYRLESYHYISEHLKERNITKGRYVYLNWWVKGVIEKEAGCSRIGKLNIIVVFKSRSYRFSLDKTKRSFVFRNGSWGNLSSSKLC